ncbi:protein lethal(2)essential for life [Andrena cerasifolii]|uniref:protein lethal(2)essential for life n=1 Tax=Andrena cerasifolii TaxID=2819439 RepID=UPI004037CE10
MSLLPLLFSAWWADMERPHRMWDQNFGMGLHPEQLLLPNSMMDKFNPTMMNRAAMDMFFRQLAESMRRGESSGTSTITADKDMFKVILDVQQFKPEEISVKLADRFVVVEAKHEEKRDQHGLISRQFMRKYMLPEQVDEKELSSSISSDGILMIMAPLKQAEEKPNERKIKIELTGKPAVRGEAEATTPSFASNEVPSNQQMENPEQLSENLQQKKSKK